VFLNPALTSALDRITERASDVRRAFDPGALPQHDDVAVARAGSDFTLDPLSVALPDRSYLVTADARGNFCYSRNGSMHVRDGRLLDAQGNPVLGWRYGSAALSELQIDPVDEALGRADGMAVEPDGSVAYTRTAIDPRAGQRELQRVVVGRIALARFPAATRLQPAGAEHFVPPEGVIAYTGKAGSDGFGLLQPMRRAHSNIDIDESLDRLKAAYTAFDALTAAEMAKYHLGKTAMDLVK